MPSSVSELLALGLERSKAGRWHEASEAFRVALARDPTSAPAAFNLAATLQALGRVDEAIEIHERLRGTQLRLDALRALAQLRPARISAADERDMLAAAAGSSGVDRAKTLYALGYVCDSRGRYDEAFDRFAQGARAYRGTIDPEAELAALDWQVARAKSVFTREFIAFHEGAGHRARPIFIVGLPRSGSTLLEQILAAHPRVRALGESPALATVTAGQYPFQLNGEKTPDHFRRLARAYLNGSSARTVDKALGSYTGVGMIHLMFPGAVILHSVRDAADSCLSRFFQLFETGNEASYDLGDLGRGYVRYREMMDHWSTVLPGRVIDVEHEALIADPEARIRWLLEVCGLPWDERCLRFHEARRPVSTASLAQVRQPIFTGSVGRWRFYRRHLGPLFEALGPYAPDEP
ncbi:MAG: sulfotransferase [Caulobacterales bacterium]